MNKSSEEISPSKEGVSPLGISRYGRTRKPKVSEDFCDIDDAIERCSNESVIKSTRPLFKSPPQQSNWKTKNASPNSTEKTKIYDVKIKSITHVQIAKTNTQSTRKFFKTAHVTGDYKRPHITADYVPPKFIDNDIDGTNIFDSSPVDVSQVLKIITAKNTPEVVPVETKKSPKQLKTYINKRKKATQQSVVVESFGLPDEPIIPLVDSDAPFESIKELDVDRVEPEKVNLIDNSLIDNFWQVDSTSNLMVETELNESNVSDETAVKNKENLGNKSEDQIETPKKEKKTGKSPLKGTPKLGKQKNSKEVMRISPLNNEKATIPSIDYRSLEDIGSCKDKCINISKLKDQLSVKIENGKNVSDQENKVAKLPKIISNIEPLEQSSTHVIDPNLSLRSSPLDDTKATTTMEITESQNQDIRIEELITSNIIRKPDAESIAVKETSNFESDNIVKFVEPSNDIKLTSALSPVVVLDRTMEKFAIKCGSATKIDAAPKETEYESTDGDKLAQLIPSEEDLKNPLEDTKEAESRKVEISTDQGSGVQLGDLMWAKIGTFPYWPCIITLEPGTELFKKIFFKRLNEYHVRFFGDNGRRSWVKEKNLLPFTSVDELKKLQKQKRNETIVPTPNTKQDRNWLIGIDEAKSIQDKSLSERFEYFDNLFKTKMKKKQKSEGDKLRKKRKLETTGNTPEDFSDTEYIPSHKKKKQKTEEIDQKEDVSQQTEGRTLRRQSLQRRNKVSPTKDSQEGDQEDTSKMLNSTDSKSRITRLSISKHQVSPKKRKIHLLDDSDTDSVTSVKESPTFTVEDQIALHKRNHLFKGVSRERVCQVCLKPGTVLKCKGRCCSYYHVDCAKIGYTGTDIDSKAVSETSDESDKNTSVAGEKVEIMNISNTEVVVTTSTNTVEIVHIKDRKRLTPTDITLDDNPDFQKLPLLDQIDQKMKEVMQPVVDNPLYADSTTDCSSADNSPIKTVRTRNGLLGNHEIDASISNKIDMEVEEITNGSNDDKKSKDIVDFKCKNCLEDFDPLCFVCNRKNSKSNSDIRQRCSLSMCGRFYHPECLKAWPQTQWSVTATTKLNLDTFVCPAHVCHTCVSDDPRMASSRCPSDKVVKCLQCPATYHTSTSCVPAGTEILTSTQIVCPRHGTLKSSKKRGNSTINTTWCFICSKGGALICCETCPTSVHAECLDINYTDDDKFICEDCETGRFPLYDEVVWVKLGSYRWWPALILFPNEVPDNVKNLGHNDGEFVVKFFGTHDHYWISKGRVFVFEEGDTGGGGGHSSKRKVDAIFRKSIQEATVAHQLKREFKESVIRQSVEKSKNKPPPYTKIKANRPVGNVRQFDGNISNTTPCECDPKEDNPCGPDSDCLNRLLMTECDPDVCPAGEKCQNQCFEKRVYPPLVPYKTEGRGWGLKSLEPISVGQFVIEYVGEMIDEQEYQRRIKKMHEQKEENYYFLTIDKDRMIDAGPKGNVARFMNHCCQPNCETQKWTVNGDTRVGLFAVTDIPANTELTFNYNLECVGKEKQICQCGAPNCSGFIGVKAKQVQDEEKHKHRRKYKKRKRSPTPQIQETKEPCFVCSETGDVRGCNNKICTKYYHLKCANLDEWTEKWICPWHNCNICSKRTIRCCAKCVNSYCPPHSDGNIRHDKLLGFICSEHDPSKAESHGTGVSTKPAENILVLQTEETDITSTTSEETSVELELPTVNPAHRTTEPSDIISLAPNKNSSTPVEDIEKRKRGRPKKSSTANNGINLAESEDQRFSTTPTKEIDVQQETKKLEDDISTAATLILHRTTEPSDAATSTPVKNNSNSVENIETRKRGRPRKPSRENLEKKMKFDDEDSTASNKSIEKESPGKKLDGDDITATNLIKPKIMEIHEDSLTKKETKSVEKESAGIKCYDEKSIANNAVTPKDKIILPNKTISKKERNSVEKGSPRLSNLRSSRRLNTSEVLVNVKEEEAVSVMTLRKRCGSM